MDPALTTFLAVLGAIWVGIGVVMTIAALFSSELSKHERAEMVAMGIFFPMFASIEFGKFLAWGTYRIFRRQFGLERS